MVQKEEYVDDGIAGLSGNLLRLNLDVACTSEKSATLAAFSSRLFSKFGDTSTEETANVETDLEPALLSIIIENLIQELELLMDMHRKELVSLHEMAPESGSLDDHLSVCRWRLRDCEGFLKLSRERVLDLKARSERTWAAPMESGDTLGEGVRGHGNGDCAPGRCGYGEEEYGQGEGGAEDTCVDAAWARFLEAENTAEVLLGVSKELLLHLQMQECDGVKDVQRLGFLQGRVEEAEAEVEAMKVSADEKQKMLNSVIYDMEILVGDLKERASESEKKAASLAETNSVLTGDVLLLRGEVQSLQNDLRAAMDERAVWGGEVKRRTKAITGLLVQIGAERGRLHKEVLRLMGGE